MSDITKILREFNVPMLSASENGITFAEVAMAQEIARLRARESFIPHIQLLADLRAEVDRYRAGLQRIVDADGWWDAPSLARDLLAGKDVT